jgi:hypothetical protein
MLSLDGPIKVTHSLVEGAGVDGSALRKALASGDAVALYQIDPEYAPSWCPTCGLSYCDRCWTVWTDYDEGFYDCTRARCPLAHERILDD